MFVKKELVRRELLYCHKAILEVVQPMPSDKNYLSLWECEFFIVQIITKPKEVPTSFEFGNLTHDRMAVTIHNCLSNSHIRCQKLNWGGFPTYKIINIEKIGSCYSEYLKRKKIGCWVVDFEKDIYG